MSTMSTTIGDGADKVLALQIHHAQKVQKGEVTIPHWEWFLDLSKVERDALLGHRPQISATADPRFTVLSSFELTVPKKYGHDKQLATFAENSRSKFAYWNDDTTDAHFARTSNKLVPGKKYVVDVIGINQLVTSEECLGYLQARKAILVGAQGISLVWQLKKDKFPIGKWMASFDVKDVLWKDTDGNHRVPCVLRFSDGDWGFRLALFVNDWNDGNCLLCFREV